MKKSILVLASKSDDYIYKESQKKPIRKKKGAAFFIKKAFDDLGIKYRLVTSVPCLLLFMNT